jgi:hypothetical protein
MLIPASHHSSYGHDFAPIFQAGAADARASGSFARGGGGPSRHIEQSKVFWFRIAKNHALTRLSKKSRQITDCFEKAGATVVMGTATAYSL